MMRFFAIVIASSACTSGSGPLAPGSGDPIFQYMSGGCPDGCCPIWGCGSNSASLGHELDDSGQAANLEGVMFRGFRDKDGQPLELVVMGDELQGVRADGKVVRGADLLDASIQLVRMRIDPEASSRTFRPRTFQQSYRLRITAYDDIPFWVAPDGDTVPIYKFVVEPAGEPPYDLCEPPKAGLQGWGDVMGGAVVFRGDRYDARTKTLIEDPGTWFNVACAGTAIAKLHLLRHTRAGGGGSHDTTRMQRQALLKMLVADYCGTGRSFTLDGQPLTYSFKKTWAFDTNWDTAVSLDAVWNAQHAVCLNVPRLKDEYSQIRSIIVSQCAKVGHVIKPCKTGLIDDLKAKQPGDQPWGAYAVSANRQEN